MLSAGLYEVPAGHVASVVTHLEMTARPAARRDVPRPEGVTLEHVARPDPDWYRDLYRRVGTRDWLWFERLGLASDDLAGMLRDPGIELLALMQDGRAEGLAELDFRQAGVCELSYFGVTAAMIGKGAGRMMMESAIARAWARPIGRFQVHTCTLDSAGALDFYCRSGFVPVRREVEIAPDPRLAGLIPRASAPRVPRL